MTLSRPDTRLRDLEALALLLDEKFRIPGTSIRFGVDGVVGLVPGIGDVATTLVSLYLVARARDLGLPNRVLIRMLGNIAIDFLVGAVPLVGDVFDVAFKANRRNIDLLKRELGRQAASPAVVSGSGPHRGERSKPAFEKRKP